MKARLFLTISIAATMLWSCQFDDVLSTPSNDGVIRVMSTLTKTESASGTTTNSPTTNDNFKNDDIIFVWADKTNSTDDYIKAWKLTATDTNGNFSGESKAWPYDGSSLNFHALHGNFTESALNNKNWSDLTSLTHTVLPDQRSDKDRRQSDLLFAEKTGATHGSNVELSFRHLLAKITVKLDLNNSMGITTDDFKNATVWIMGIQPEAIFDSSTKKVSSSEGEAIEINAGAITEPSNLSSEAYYAGCAIVPLQTINANQSLIKIILKNNRTFIYKASETTTFQEGQEYTYTLTILGQQITGSLSVSPFLYVNESISFDEYFDYSIELKNRAYLGSSANPHDLSYDYNGQMNTANCYVVTHPGYYKFPLVYGNAIKNGATNAIAYGSSTFVNHLGNQISDPYIYNNTDCRVGSAALVWQDAPNLITNIELSDDEKFIKFEIKRDNIEQGNAIIAVKEGSGAIMWSWHIWVSKKDVYASVKIKNVTGITYYFMPVPLGWDDDIVDKPNCTLYQWGRKDPFVGSDGTVNCTNKIWYDCNGYGTKNNPETISQTSKSESIKNPNKFIVNESGFWDIITTNDNWNSNIKEQTNSSFNIEEVYKTVYDPSPMGFKMPPQNAFSGFTSDGNNKESTSANNNNGYWRNYGWNFYTGGNNINPTDFWIAGGFRHCKDTHLDHVTIGGYYWAANPASVSIYGCGLRFYNTAVYPQFYDGRTYGFCIRPIAEKSE